LNFKKELDITKSFKSRFELDFKCHENKLNSKTNIFQDQSVNNFQALNVISNSHLSGLGFIKKLKKKNKWN